VSNFLLQTLASTLVTGALIAAVLWLAKAAIMQRLSNAVRHEYDLKLEAFRDSLKRSAEVEIARMKADLDISAEEHRVRFGQLHERRIEAIAETYAKLQTFKDAVVEYTKIAEFGQQKPRGDRLAGAVPAQADLYAYFSQKRVFLPAPVADRIAALNQTLVQIANKFTLIVDPDNQRRSPLPNATEVWIELHERVEKEIPEALRALEDELRILLGDKPDLKPASANQISGAS